MASVGALMCLHKHGNYKLYCKQCKDCFCLECVHKFHDDHDFCKLDIATGNVLNGLEASGVLKNNTKISAWTEFMKVHISSLEQVQKEIERHLKPMNDTEDALLTKLDNVLVAILKPTSDILKWITQAERYVRNW